MAQKTETEKKPLDVTKGVTADQSQAASILLLANKGPVMVLEYRGCKLDEIKWVDKKDGQARSMVKRSHFCEFSDGSQVSIDEMGDSEESFKAVPFARGDKVLCRVSSFAMDKGKINCRGELVAQSVVAAA